MPIYPIVNKITGEKKEITLSIEKWTEFSKENPEWIRDWSDPFTAPNSCEVGEWKNKLISKHPSWNSVLDTASKMPGSRVKKI